MLERRRKRENNITSELDQDKKGNRKFGFLNNKQNIKSRKYGQVKLRASRRGIYSCLFALAAIICQCLMLYAAYATYGEAPSYVGSIGLISAMGSLVGIYYGFLGFREREKNYLSCKVGIVINALVVIGYIMLFVRGLF